MTITIDKAIEVLSNRPIRRITAGGIDFYDAIKLGVEALKRLKEEKDKIPDALWRPLPGETKE